jgi:dolichyl-phosphate beta-glucosyltransferase
MCTTGFSLGGPSTRVGPPPMEKPEPPARSNALRSVESRAVASRSHTLVIPCYNEALRLPVAQVEELLADRRISVLLVNDGSTDATGKRLDALCAEQKHAAALSLEKNQGKAEAVRAGLLAAIESGAEVVGYADADFATPPSELLRLLDALEQPGIDVVIGSRVARLGADIERSHLRHYLGRIFATAAAFTLDVRVYDTQCGAKVFRVTDALRAALARPFNSTWAFDVELLARLFGRLGVQPSIDPVRAIEVPLRAWHDVGGSKLRFSGMVKGLLELSALAAKSRWR